MLAIKLRLGIKTSSFFDTPTNLRAICKADVPFIVAITYFDLVSFFIFLLASKYSNKIRGGALLDKDFLKPQAFHDIPITRSGGVAAIISLTIFFVIYYLLYSKILYDYILISYSMFLIGFLDDLKINIKPAKRLIIMVSFPSGYDKYYY